MSDACLFCRIARDEIPSERVLETDELIVFRDIDPKAPVHLLVIPRRHIASLSTTTDEDRALLGALQEAAVEVARREGIERSGWRLVTNIGEDGGQSVGHLHYHVLGGRALGWPPG
ncbi:MAG: histidine triad nucleotide-binding protein [Longimicrobiales bacterium]|nr:histidine triad nucleotide-binding protein [Longimicrobiales bacterium]